MPRHRKRSGSSTLRLAIIMLVWLGSCTQEQGAPSPAGSLLTLQQAPLTLNGGASPPVSSSSDTAAPISLSGGSPAPPVAGTSQFYYGSGSSIGIPGGTAADADIQPDNAGGITLNFANADVHDVAKAVLGDLLKLNYEIAPSVQGAITMTTASPVNTQDVLPVFEQSLLLAGFALVQQNGLYQIIPAADAPRQAGTPLVAQPGEAVTPGFGVEIVPLHYVSAAQMQTLLGPMVPPGSIISTDTSRNILMIAGTSDQRAAILGDVSLFDVDQMAGKSFALFRPQYIDANDLAQGLTAIVTGPEGQGLGGLVRLIALSRLNAVLAISNQPQYLTELQNWVVRLDQPSDSNSQQLYVYPVQNGKASDLAAVLTQAFTQNNAQNGNGSSDLPGGSLSADVNASNPSGGNPTLPSISSVNTTETTVQPGALPDQSNSNGIPGLPDDNSGAAAQGNAAQPANPAGGGSDQDSNDVTSLSTGGGDGSGPPPIKVIADNVNNALVIRCLPNQYPEIQQALSELDVQPLEVLIEASVAEVTLNNQLQYGVQYYIQGGSLQAIQTTAAKALVTPALPGFAAIFQQGQSIPIILSALQAVTTVNVLSAPQLMVLNNQTANLQVGDEVPIATQQSQSTLVNDAPIVNSIAYQNTGVILKVTPRVNAGGLVTMDISQEVSSVSNTTTSTLNSPTISVRTISSTVAIHNGQTVALGGLISDNRTNSKSGVPGLQDIPYLGGLFSTTNHQVARTELLVLLTPHVVGNQSQAQAITDELRAKLSGTLPALSTGQ